MFADRILEAIQGVGHVRAENLRSSGSWTWSDVAQDSPLTLFDTHESGSPEHLIDLLRERRVLRLSEHVPVPQWYLLALEYPELVTFLDIETTGLSRKYHNLTIVGWSQGGRWQYEVLGRELLPSRAFLTQLQGHPIVVTFNGALFDIPFLRSVVELPEIVSVDLRFLARRLGYAGSLKRVEESLRIKRPASVVELRGESAPGLWYAACRGNVNALKRLLLYNFYDVRGLAKILQAVSPLAIDQDLTYSIPNKDLARAARRVLRPSIPTLNRESLNLQHLRLVVAQTRSDALPMLVRASVPHDPGPVVGIDLTGSAKRASGIAVISGDEVDTLLLQSDEDILNFIDSSGAILVSIDAPLSMPRGRISVTDDDPGREEFGIMRWAERELKRRGVNVYPALLPSMQRLTERGMSLARRIRETGVPCIESFPGAAQDILAMPRKQVGLTHLHSSLTNMGWQLKTESPTHDELDAVTSALVGLFFLDGRFEELGAPGEDPMIIPDLAVTTAARWSGVVVSGLIAAGKTTLAKAIADAGFTYGVYSEVIADECRARGIGTGRVAMQRVGLEMHRNLGQREIGGRLLSRMGFDAPISVDGARWLEDISFLRERTGGKLIHIHVETSLTTRLDRFIKRGGTHEEFERANAHEVEGQCDRLAKIADHVFDNSGDHDDLSNYVGEILRLYEDVIERTPIFVPSRSNGN